jgi:tRNA-2-methylthio-N6-dimethylallyladenosine synthase
LTFVTSHPKDFNEKLARTLARLPQLNPRLHLPVQSGSNAVLRRMNRKYTVEQYLEKIALFRELCPDWALTTDLIAGFPGETEADFERTLELCEQLRFAQAFSFVYSQRRGTPAALWEQVPAETGSARLRRLAATIDATVRAWHDRKIGSTVRALVEGRSKKDRSNVAARTTDNVTLIAPLGDLTERDLVRTPWLDVSVESAHVWGCSGSIVGRAERYDSAAASAGMPRFVDLIALR